ncbi:MAG: Ger(x)C family spore germination protein [Bacillota bacterium]
MKKKIAALTAVLVLVLCGGCWDRRELSEHAIILGAGVDRRPDGAVELTLQLARPGAFGGGMEGGGAGNVILGQNVAWVVSAAGEDIYDAQRNLALQVPRHLYWGHSALLVFGEETARHGVRDATNFFHRHPQPRETMWVMVARGTAKKILQSHSELEKTSAQAIGFLARAKAGHAVRFIDLIKDLASPGANPALTRLELVRQGEPQGPGMEKAPKHQEVVFTGTAVFKDDKLVGWLDRHETRGLLWLRGEMKRGVVTIPSPSDPTKKISFEITRSKTKVEPFYDGKTISFGVDITTEGYLVEQQSKENLIPPEVLPALEKRLAKDIEERCRMALEKAQGEYRTDVFRFGDAFHRKYKKAWRTLKKRWNEEFADAEISVEAKVRIRNTGLLTKRASLKK